MSKSVKPPKVPDVLVYLGRAVELDGDAVEWRWTKNDDWVVCSSESGRRLFLFSRPKKKTTVPDAPKAKQRYGAFNRRDCDSAAVGKVASLRSKSGRALHIVYESDKFGDTTDYIHLFKSPPIIWVDRAKFPSVIALTGGKIKTTARGIMG